MKTLRIFILLLLSISMVSGGTVTDWIRLRGGANKGYIEFEGTTNDTFETRLEAVDPTQDNTITLPDASGTVALTNAIITGTGTNDFVTQWTGATSIGNSPFQRLGNQFLVPGGGFPTPNYSWVGDTNTGFNQVSDGIMSVIVNGANFGQWNANAGWQIFNNMSLSSFTISLSTGRIQWNGGVQLDGITNFTGLKAQLFVDHAGNIPVYQESSSALTLTADDTVVTLDDTIKLLTSDDNDASVRTFTLNIAAMMVDIPYTIEWTSTFGGELLDTGVYHLNGDFRPDTFDQLIVRTDGTVVKEVTRSTNRN